MKPAPPVPCMGGRVGGGPGEKAGLAQQDVGNTLCLLYEILHASWQVFLIVIRSNFDGSFAGATQQRPQRRLIATRRMVTRQPPQRPVPQPLPGVLIAIQADDPLRHRRRVARRHDRQFGAVPPAQLFRQQREVSSTERLSGSEGIRS